MGSLLLLRKRPLFHDHFGGAVGAALSSQWTAALGAFDQDGAGRVRGKTLAADGNELIADGNMEAAGVTSWPAYGTPTTREKNTTSPIGGTQDLHCVADANFEGVNQALSGIAGLTYAYSFTYRVASGKCTVVCGIGSFTDLLMNQGTAATNTTVSGTKLATVNWTSFWVANNVIGAGEFYIDNITIQRTLAIATRDLGRANHDLRWRFIMPGAGVVPGGYIVRYQDLSNYWYWRIKPGTAGDDLELVEVNAGLATVRAAADIDWAASTAYDLRLVSQANVYTAYVNNVQKGTYTDAASFLATNTKIGLWSAGAANILTDELLAKAA